MKKNKIFTPLIFILMLFTTSFAYTQQDILKSIKYVALKEGISPKILYTIVKIESDFQPLAISFLTNKENALYFKKLQTNKIKINISNYSLNNSKWVVTIHPSTIAHARGIAKLLIEDGYSIDVGLGQLNSHNFTLDEIKYIFDPVYNLTKCSRVLRKCFNVKNKDITNTIECYNYGMRNRGSNPYYKKFYDRYKKEFGD